MIGTIPKRMRAVLIPKHGGTEVLTVDEIETPHPGPGEVLVAVHACGLNHLDIFVRRGMPGKPTPLPFISGADVAGLVARLGEGVRGPPVGTRILLDPAVPAGALGEDVPGGFAEFVVAPAENAIPLPEHVGFVEAAALPMAFGTAWRMLVTRGELRVGERTAILGASGGVGTAAVQIAKLAGAYVYATTSSDRKGERLLALGADEIIRYDKVTFEEELWRRTRKRGVDLVVEGTGRATWRGSLRAVRNGGRIVTCGATTGFAAMTDLRYLWTREITIRGSDGWRRHELDTVLDLCFQGRLQPVIDRVVPLEDLAEAERAMEDRELVGKIVLRVRPADQSHQGNDPSARGGHDRTPGDATRL